MIGHLAREQTLSLTAVTTSSVHDLVLDFAAKKTDIWTYLAAEVTCLRTEFATV